jgi:hypothetical protein
MTLKIAACIIDGVVVNASVYDEDLSVAWLDAVKNTYDKVLIVDRAATDWEEYEVNKLRPPMPVEENKNYIWDEPTLSWKVVTND